MHSRLFSSVVVGPVAPLPPLSLRSVVVCPHLVTMSTHGELLSSSSVSIGDVMWKRALESVPAPLVGALRDAGLDDASTLVHFPRWSEDHFEEFLLGSGGSSLRQTAGAKDQTTSTGTVISSFVCTVQALDSRRTSSRNMCC